MQLIDCYVLIKDIFFSAREIPQSQFIVNGLKPGVSSLNLFIEIIWVSERTELKRTVGDSD